jgi:hypothetical protein
MSHPNTGADNPSPWRNQTQTTPHARRNPRIIAIGLLCACLGGLGAAVTWQRVSHSQSAVVVQVPRSRGEIIQAGDLSTLDIGAPSGSYLPGEQLSSLIGQHALVDLPAGSLPTPASIGNLRANAGQTTIGLKLAAGSLPSGGLPAGTRVQLSEVSDSSKHADLSASGLAEYQSAAQAPVAGRVFTATSNGSPTRLPDGASWVINLSVTAADAPTLTALGANNQLVLIRLGAS